MVRVLRELHRIESSLDEIDIRGSSDQRIVRELFAHHRLDDKTEVIQSFLETYFKALAEELPKGRVTLHPGIAEILEKVQQRDDLVQGLLTGNMARGAQLKLEHAGIWHYFAFGAFGDDSADRNELGPFALRRAREKHDIEFSPQQVYIIGDTPHDIACAKAIGARAIAVATGSHTVNELKAHQPHAVFINLQDSAAFLAVIEK